MPGIRDDRSLGPRLLLPGLGAILLLIVLIASPGGGQRGSASAAGEAAFGELWVQAIENTPNPTINARFRAIADQAEVVWPNFFVDPAPRASELLSRAPLGQPLDPGGHAARVQPNGSFPILALVSNRWSDTALVQYSAGRSATEQWLPWVQRAYGSQAISSVIRIQNASSLSEAEVEIAFYGAEGERLTAILRTLPPGGSVEIDLSNDPALSELPQGLAMSALVSAQGASDRFVAAATSARADLRAAMALRGRSPDELGSQLYAARVSRRWARDLDGGGLALADSFIVVVNSGIQAADVTLDYRGVDIAAGAPGNTCAGQTYTHGGVSYSIPALGMRVFAQGPEAGPVGVGDSGLPDSCLASAIISSDGPDLSAAVIEVEDGGTRMAAYPAAPVGSAIQHLQLLRHSESGRGSSVDVMNAGAESLAVDLTFTYVHQSSTQTHSKTLPVLEPGATWHWDPAMEPPGTIPGGVHGTVRLRGRKPGGTPLLVAVARESARSTGSDIASYGAQAAPEEEPGGFYPAFYAPDVWRQQPPTETPVATSMPTATPTGVPSPTASATNGPTETATRAPSQTASPDPSATATEQATATPTQAGGMTPTPSSTPVGPASPTPAPTITRQIPCARSFDVGLVAQAANDSESQLLEALLPAHAAAFEAATGLSMGYFVYRQDLVPPHRDYRHWLEARIEDGFGGLDFCANAYLAVLSYDDLAAFEIRDRVDPLPADWAAARRSDFLARAWEQLSMTQTGASSAAQLAAPWLRSGCSESFANLAILASPVSTDIVAARRLLDFLLAEPQQILNYSARPLRISGASVPGFRLAYPTLQQLYLPDGQPDDPRFQAIACETRPISERPNPDRVEDAIEVGKDTLGILRPVRDRLGANEYSFGIDTANVVYVESESGIAAAELARGEGMRPQQSGEVGRLAFVAAGERVEQAFTTEALAARAGQPLGVSIGILAVYDRDAPPLGPPGPSPQRPPERIFLPGLLKSAWLSTWTEVYRQFLVTLRPAAGASGFETVLLDPEGRVADLPGLQRELALSIDPVLVTADPSSSVDVWAEEGSKKICFKIDKRKLCVRIGR